MLVPTCQHVNMRTCQHVNMRTCEHVNMRTCQHANMRTCQHANRYFPLTVPGNACAHNEGIAPSHLPPLLSLGTLGIFFSVPRGFERQCRCTWKSIKSIKSKKGLVLMILVIVFTHKRKRSKYMVVYIQQSK